MAFVVEDGTGLSNANSYIEVAYADSYFTDRSIAAWSGDNATKQSAIVRATDYIEARWADSFLGWREFPDTPQSLSFPRLGLYDREGYLISGIPDLLKRATAEYALRALTVTLLPDPVVSDASGREIESAREKVGPIETEYTYGELVPLRPYPAADRLLEQFLRTAGRAYR